MPGPAVLDYSTGCGNRLTPGRVTGGQAPALRAGQRVVFPPGWCSFSLLPGFFALQGGLAAFDGLSRSQGDVAGALDRFRLA
jgi:hypothetical protein